MPDEKFHILTRQEAPRNLSENVHWHSVSGQGKHVSIEELLPLYQKAACVVVPLKESPQPSGQSVAMQAMMCGAPVVMTHTAGWWEWMCCKTENICAWWIRITPLRWPPQSGTPLQQPVSEALTPERFFWKHDGLQRVLQNGWRK
jgi:hypothetical protein